MQMPIYYQNATLVTLLDLYIANIYTIIMKQFFTLPEFVGFDWSGGNGEKNWQRHHVTPSESEQAFFNQPLLVARDDSRKHSENRFYALGHTDTGRELFIVCTMRETLIRVISSRDMSRKERKVYRSL